jgi:RNA polymerase sigma-70 factor (ECF subfamily)
MDTTLTPSPAHADAELDDTQAIRRTAEGDSSAFEHLYHKYKARIHALCRRLLGDSAMAEDLVQETFMLAFRHIATFRGSARFSTWLFQIAINNALMRVRQAKARIVEVSLDEFAEDGKDLSGKDSSRYLGKLGHQFRRSHQLVDHIHLERAIATLAPGYKMVFFLHDVKGYQHCEIARMLGCSVGNTKSQLHKARLRLRRQMTPGCEPSRWR